MEYIKREKTVVDYAYDIIQTHNELMDAKREIKRLQTIEKEYYELLNSSIKHNDKMMANLLAATLAKSST